LYKPYDWDDRFVIPNRFCGTIPKAEEDLEVGIASLLIALLIKHFLSQPRILNHSMYVAPTANHKYIVV
jgi:hypothetical protein